MFPAVRKTAKYYRSSQQYQHGWMMGVADLWKHFKPRRGTRKLIGLKPAPWVRTKQFKPLREAVGQEVSK